ncbi:MAG: hypothetical protein IJY98_00520 [Bacteroidaceae bacterium]|nr:hypothetical protein [Bacteroidaceae bacterium]
MGKLFDSVDGCVTVPNPSLEPEYTTVENIGDRRYRPYSCGISAPGRNFTLSLRLFAL